MSKKINLIIILMSACTLLLLGLQAYWNYRSYQNTSRIFKSDISDALDKAVAQQMDLKRDRFAGQYEKWLGDTSLITITVHYSDSMRSNIFRIRDTHPPFRDRSAFSIGFNELKKPIYHLTPGIKAAFIKHFVKNLISRDLRTGTAYYYTQRLGDSLMSAFARDHLDKELLSQMYRAELAERDIEAVPALHITKYQFKGFRADAGTVKKTTATRSFKYGFSSPMLAINATFPHPDLVFLSRMKWVLLASLVLIGITVFCYAYTIRTMLSQKKLAELKDDFVNNMTHELKTPVATISIAAEAIQDFKVSPATAAEYLSIIRFQSANLTHLIDQLLKSMLNGERVVEMETRLVSLDLVVNDCLQQYQPGLLAARAQLTAQVRDEIKVAGDASHLGNVVANLIDNAIKYSTQPPVISLDLRKENNEAVLTVRNEGPAIPDAYHERIFDRFFRVPNGDIHDVKGYGLGLSYVRDIAQRHGGRIELRTETAANIFHLYLPLA